MVSPVLIKSFSFRGAVLFIEISEALPITEKTFMEYSFFFTQETGNTVMSIAIKNGKS